MSESMYLLRRQSLVELLLLIAGIGGHPRVALGQPPASQEAAQAASDAQVAALVKQASARMGQGQLALAETLLERARSLACSTQRPGFEIPGKVAGAFGRVAGGGR
jgi:hypothetical protein